MIKSPLYTAHATSTGGRTGSGKTDDGRLSVTLSSPKEMGGAGGDGTNPEQLFAVGYSACFLGALKVMAGKEKVKIPEDTTIEAAVSFGENANEGASGFNIAVELKGHIPGLSAEQTRDLMEKAHTVCPYSNATRGNVEVKLSAV